MVVIVASGAHVAAAAAACCVAACARCFDVRARLSVGVSAGGIESEMAITIMRVLVVRKSVGWEARS